MIQVLFLNFTQTFLSHPRTAAGFNQYTQSLKFKASFWVLKRIWIVSYAVLLWAVKFPFTQTTGLQMRYEKFLCVMYIRPYYMRRKSRQQLLTLS